MEDDNGLELSLGLFCGGNSKGRNGTSSDNRAEEGDKGGKTVDGFRSFFHAGSQTEDSGAKTEDSGTKFQRSDSVQPQENFFNDLSKTSIDAADADTSMNRFWVSNSNRSVEHEAEKRSEVGNKRKLLLNEISNQKKHERETHIDFHDKTKASHLSLTTEDGSTAENEDVAESEVEGSTSRLLTHRDNGSTRFIGVGELAWSKDALKDMPGISISTLVKLHEQKRFNNNSSAENGLKLGNMAYSVPFSVQSVNVMNAPNSLPQKDTHSIGISTASGHPLPGMAQTMPTTNISRSGIQAVNPSNFPLMFGYSQVQLPTLDKDNSWVSMSSIPHNSSEATRYNGRSTERAKADGKQHALEEGSSTQAEDVKESNMNPRLINASDRPAADGSSVDFSTIKTGISADLKFGGSGSCPNLPWVSAKGSGPNGRTISGVTYRYSANQVRIVCACHSSHMTPEEFVQHANEEYVHPDGATDGATGLNTFTSNNPSASAHT